jgi:hypothetical protein
MLVHTSLQLGDTRLEEQNVLLLVGKLLLLERENLQQHTDELTDCWRRCRPIHRCDAIRWCQVVHAASMS